MISNILERDRKTTADIVEIERTAVTLDVTSQPDGPGKRISKYKLLGPQSRFIANEEIPLL